MAPNTSAKARKVVKFGDLNASPTPQDVTSTPTADEIKVAVPAGANAGSVKLQVVTPGFTASSTVSRPPHPSLDVDLDQPPPRRRQPPRDACETSTSIF